MEKYAIIVAGGSGSRMGSSLPKQFLQMEGKPILMHTLEAFYKADPSIQLILVLPESQLQHWQQLINQFEFSLAHRIVSGGDSRFQSVKNGLALIKPNEHAIVAVHDGVRPFIPTSIIQQAYKQAAQVGSAVCAVDSKDSIRMLGDDGSYKAVERSRVKIIQTPQLFKADKLIEAYQTDYQEAFTDDASVYEAAGFVVHLTEGSYENIKITTPEDMEVAQQMCRRLGNS